MAEAAAPSQRRGTASQGRTARAKQWLSRATGPDSDERQTATLIGKSALVATISWYIANDLVQAQSPAFAPFSAVLIMQITAYQAVLQALRCVGAVSAGVALQALFGALIGSNLISFVLVALVALIIGRWQRLGTQGFQVVTAAFFAFSTYAVASSATEGAKQLGQIVLLVLIGCGVGVVVNVLVLPPVQYRSAEYGIRTLGHSQCDLAGDIAAALRAEELDKERTQHWRHRAKRLEPVVAQAQSSVQTAWESTYYHPFRVLRRRLEGGGPSFTGYQQLTDALERVSHQLASVTRSFDQWHDAGEHPEYREFVHRYGDFMADFADVVRVIGRLDEDRLDEQVRELSAAADKAQQARNALAELGEGEAALPLDDPSRPFGILLAEAVRLLEEVAHTSDVLQQAVEAPESVLRR